MCRGFKQEREKSGLVGNEHQVKVKAPRASSGHPGTSSRVRCRDPAPPLPGQPPNCPASAPLGENGQGPAAERAGSQQPTALGEENKRHEKTALVMKSPPIPACFDSEFLCYGRLVERTDFRCPEPGDGRGIPLSLPSQTKGLNTKCLGEARQPSRRSGGAPRAPGQRQRMQDPEGRRVALASADLARSAASVGHQAMAAAPCLAAGSHSIPASSQLFLSTCGIPLCRCFSHCSTTRAPFVLFRCLAHKDRGCCSPRRS